ncbi:MAG: 2-oxoacid:acceptor oxidoreductase family protein [Candidatus Ratteibacteria bacterium]
MEKVKILLGGSGGQGILTLGRLISYASLKKNYQVSCLPTYSAEMRGGYIYCFVTISKRKEIFSPLSESCDIGLFLNELSYEMLKKYLKKESFIILNSTLIKKKLNKKNSIIFEIPATEIAEKIGDGRITNMVAAGFLSKLITENFFYFDKELLIGEIGKIIKEEDVLNLSIRGIEEGWNFKNF